MNYNKTIHRVRRQRSHRHLWSISLSIAKYQWPSFRRRRSCALSATTMVERLITIAPTKGQNKPKYEITIPVVRSLSGWLLSGRKLWKNPKTQLWEPTFAILTGEPNGKFAEI